MIKQKRFDEICSQFKTKKVLIYGDLILDRYIFGNVTRISPEAPVPVVQIKEEECRLGGAGNVSANITKMGATTLLLGIVGKDIYSREIFQLIEKNNLIFATEQNNSLVKTRVISQRQQIVRIDRESNINITPDIEKQMKKSLENIKIDGIIVSDYAKGTVTRTILDLLK
ncbi:MAG: D-glycero-beta-D-manno-heptose-7-phosphate kinase, partial [Candidatus Aminicenantes bacterium]|nr:D-glycero-beta-D-manno-heptose-7-phosphate kinase [Candidatus Aminicenantes bacterium]